MKIGIAGIGGIGSNVARILAQAGVKQIKAVDFDSVEPGNLNRQFYTLSQAGRKKTDSLKANLLQIFPDMAIETVDRRIGPGDCLELFSDCGLVVEGFDNKHLKKMIIEELAAGDIQIVSASGIAGYALDTVSVRKIGRCRVVGDFCSDQADHVLFPPKIALVAAMMAGIVLNFLKDQAHAENTGIEQK